MYTVSTKYYTTKVQGHMKKKILSGTIAAFALATTLPLAPQASAYIGQEGEYLQWDKIDENGNRLYGSAWELTVKDSRFDEVDTYFVHDNHINPPKKFGSNEGFLPDRDDAIGRLGVLVKGSQSCLDMADCEITYELKEVTPPQGYDLPKNNAPIVIKRTPYTPQWGDTDMQWATLADDKLSFTVSPDENTKLGYYNLSMHTYYKPEDAIESFSTNDEGELVVRMADSTKHNLGVISGDKEGSDHGVKRTFQDEDGQIVIETVDGKTHNLGYATGNGHAVQFMVVAPGATNPDSSIPQVEQGKSLKLEVTNQDYLREGAIFSAPEVKTKIADTAIVSSPLEVRGAENLYEGMLISDNNQGGISVNSKESFTFFKPVQVGKVVNTKTPPTTVEKVVTETPTPSTTTVTAPPETVTSTTTVTETPGVATTTKEVTPEASTTTVTKTPEKETVTKTPEKEVVTETKKETVTKIPEKETVTETPEKETVTKTPEKEAVTTTVTPAPVTIVETETVTTTPAPVETTVTETLTPETPEPEVVYVTKTPPADMPEPARVPEEGDVLERPAKVLARTGANTSLAALLLAGQAIAVGALVGFRNRKKNQK